MGVSRVLMSSAVLLVTCFGVAFSADSPIDPGSVVLTGSASFTSQGGDLYATGGDSAGGGSARLNSFTLQSTVGGFLSRGFNLGGTFVLQNMSQGGDGVTSVGIGPKVAYFFGPDAIRSEVKGSTIPVMGASFLYRSISGGGDSVTGTSFSFSGGVVHMVTRSVALDVEAVYQIDTFKSVGGNSFGILAGLGFFIWE